MKTDVGPHLLTIPQTAERLGYKDRRSVYRLIARGELPVVQVGGVSRIDAADLDKYVEKNKRVA